MVPEFETLPVKEHILTLGREEVSSPSPLTSMVVPDQPDQSFLPFEDMTASWSPPATMVDPSAEITTEVNSRSGAAATSHEGIIAIAGRIRNADRKIPEIKIYRRCIMPERGLTISGDKRIGITTGSQPDMQVPDRNGAGRFFQKGMGKES